MQSALVFPGQGSQSVGMGKDLAESFQSAKHVFDEIDDALQQNLSNIMFEGPAEKLTLTENAQPALMGVSIAVLSVLKADFNINLVDQAKFVAGHSLGEYSALAAVDTFSLSDAAQLLKKRGIAMQRAAQVGVGGMAAILGLEVAEVENIVQLSLENDILAVANDNAIGQVVISGSATAVDRAIANAKNMGAKRAIMLPVSAPFHCLMMQPAEKVMVDALANIKLLTPKVPVVSNFTACPSDDVNEIQDLLIKQISGRVRWRESIEYMIERSVQRITEIGPGKVLTGINKRINQNIESFSIGSAESIQNFSETFNQYEGNKEK